MLQTDNSNTVFELAADLVTNTSQHIFLTGKAGTGKTTFLRHIREKIRKNTIVVAPTGVAAINAGGVTMHSFFQLPFGPFLPGNPNPGMLAGGAVTDKHSLFKNIRFNADKRTLLLELELLIIDEISMVRCDMLDAVDAILRNYRRRPLQPFGGVQVLFIGDMFQLPPVIPESEWDILKHTYAGPFFFHSKVIEQAPPLYIELKKIYRQNEAEFIDVLNAVRNNTVSEMDLAVLNNRFDPDFVPHPDVHYITLTSHNRRADAINRHKLNELPGKLFLFKGEVKNDFSEKSFPTDLDLGLKVGAQIMFIKNDGSPEKRFYNGKLATIHSINEDEIIVMVDNNELKLEKETWKNIRYTYEKINESITEEELGSFTQFPIRLAWAITIHKSQGLTFERAIIDAGSSFAAGQVYVALSRCTSLKGLVLYSMIPASAITTDQRVIAFAEKEVQAQELEAVLLQEKQQYIVFQLLKSFSWKKLVSLIEDFISDVEPKRLSNPAKANLLNQQLFERVTGQETVAHKFVVQLESLLVEYIRSGDRTAMEDRTAKAIDYFAKAITGGLLQPLQEQILLVAKEGKNKKYLQQLRGLETGIWNFLQKLIKIEFEGSLLWKGTDLFREFEPSVTKKPGSTDKKAGKPEKGSSSKETFLLYQQGKSLAEIASLRELTEGTVCSHLFPYINSGDVDIYRIMESARIDQIEDVIKRVGSDSLGQIRNQLSDDISFSDIRLVLYHMNRKKLVQK